MNDYTRKRLKELGSNGSVRLKQDVAGKWKSAGLGWLGGIVTAGGGVFLWGYVDYIVFPVDRVLSEPFFSSTSSGQAVKIVEPGEPVLYHAHFDQLRAGCASRFQSSWSNGDHIVVGEGHMPVIDHTIGEIRLTLEVTIPVELGPCSWEYRVTGEWRCNPFTVHTKIHPAVSFNIAG